MSSPAKAVFNIKKPDEERDPDDQLSFRHSFLGEAPGGRVGEPHRERPRQVLGLVPRDPLVEVLQVVVEVVRDEGLGRRWRRHPAALLLLEPRPQLPPPLLPRARSARRRRTRRKRRRGGRRRRAS
ncbi:hypothetical protein EUGRSUZ_C01054 [Eucalyptus grandis]|uniref:Uncharacterized protein n=2 Tax=Eucalyptus grandis TaxID=71139 RepID=A0ACC3LCH7_EUCGR|nr:hypothetical protein EUGRSUZ_C01054 [Eucalyptus grandis]